MELRLFQSGNRAEQIFDTAGIACHSVSFQLADIDDIIGLKDGRNQMETAVCKSGRAADGAESKISVEACTGFQNIHAAGVVDSVHTLRVVEPAGTFGDGDIVDAALSEPADDALDHQRMGRCGGGGIFCHDEIGLDHDFHAGSEIRSDVQVFKASAKGRVDQIFPVFCHGLKCLYHMKIS